MKTPQTSLTEAEANQLLDWQARCKEVTQRHAKNLREGYNPLVFEVSMDGEDIFIYNTDNGIREFLPLSVPMDGVIQDAIADILHKIEHIRVLLEKAGFKCPNP